MHIKICSGKLGYKSVDSYITQGFPLLLRRLAENEVSEHRRHEKNTS